MTTEAKPAERIIARVLPWVVVLVLAASFTQVTLRHWALWATGVREGKITEVMPEAEGTKALLTDPYAVFDQDELVGKRIWFGDTSYAVVGNTATQIVIDGAFLEVQPVVDAKPEYITGVTDKGGLTRLARKVPGVGFTLADGLLGVACALVLLQILLTLKCPGWRWPPWSIVVFLAIGLLSLINAAQLFDSSYQEPNVGSGIKEWIQLVEVLGIGFLFFQLVLRDRKTRRWATLTLLGGVALLVVVGLAEYVAIIRGTTLRGLADIGGWDSLLGFQFNPSRTGSAGTESSKNMLAAYLVVLLPMVLAMVKLPIHWGWRLAIGALAAVTSLCILQPMLLLAAVAGCLVVAATWRLRWGMGAVLGGLFIIWVAACLISPNHGKILMDSAALSRFDDPYGLLPMPLKGKNSTSAPRWMFYQQKYVEMQAALNAVSMSPVLGHGLGNYQERINMFYSNSRLPSLAVNKEPANFMEQDAHGQFIVAGVELGLVGLLALLAIFAGVVQLAFVTLEKTDDPWDRAILVGVAGSFVAILIGGWFVPFLVRGLGLILVALMALPLAISTRAEPRKPDDELLAGETSSGIITE